VAGVAWTPGCVSAQEFDIDTMAQRVVRFTSSTQFNTFDGVTNRIDGYVVIGDSGLLVGRPPLGSQFYFEVDLGSLDTGINLRNRHMRDDYLQVAKYPYTTFKGTLESVEQGPGDSLRVAAAGTLSIHGVDREVHVPCMIAPERAGYATHCAFQVRLSDYQIPIPKLMFLKLSNEIRLDLTFSVTPAAAGGLHGSVR
jgi:polyisoprenoid-binding protein YceI